MNVYNNNNYNNNNYNNNYNNNLKIVYLLLLLLYTTV
jgi:hypothetical protein